MLELILFILISIAAAMIVTGWQAYKDSPWENFDTRKFIRSYGVAIIVGAGLYYLHTSNIIVFENKGILLLTILSMERGIGEIYKGFVRKSSHAEYVKLFERLHIKFKSYSLQVLAGVIFAVIFAAILVVVLTALTSYALKLPPILAGLIAGFFGGMISATGGAIKDSQFEGFKFKKFIRSPIVGILGGLILINFTNNPLLLVLSVIGFERLVVEVYKTFIRRQVRGIFEGQKPKHPHWLKNRWIFILLYVLGALAFIVSLLM